MIKLKNIDQEIIKKLNRKKILNILRKNREMTKQDIAIITELSIPTVISNINELISEGLVDEAGVADSTGGRKPVIIRFLPDSRYSIGVDITFDGVKIILTNLDCNILSSRNFEVNDLNDIEDIMNQTIDCIEGIISEMNICKEKILGVGISLPGIVDEEKMLLESAPTMGISGAHFNKYADILGFPVFIENEANAAATAELTLGIAKEMKNLVYLSITNGIGAGVIIQGNLYKGKNKRAGEFGHMTIVPGGKLCSCGREGCLEMYASKRALIQEYNRLSQNRIKSLSEFYNLINAKSTIALQVWDDYLTYLAIGIQNIILSLDPHYVIIGGNISSFKDVLLQPLNVKIFKKNSIFKMDDTRLLVSKLQGDSSILGASMLPMEVLFSLGEKII